MIVHKFACAILFSLLFTVSLSARTIWYDIDYDKSEITFLAKSRIVNANGIFRKWKFKGKIGQSLRAVGDLTIEIASIDTDNERRDKHLQNADFFDVEKHPHALFRIKEIRWNAKEPQKVTAVGSLTIKGTTKMIEVLFQKEGSEENPLLRGAYILNREDFDIHYSSVMNPIDKYIHLSLRFFLIRHER